MVPKWVRKRALLSFAILMLVCCSVEKMQPLPGDKRSDVSLPDGVKPLAFKYCGGGHGGYALYLFSDEMQRDRACSESQAFRSIEPSVRRYK
jgi:hypothetical protein